MALKAGYYGVKKSLIDIVKSLASSVIVQSVGDGLEYDEETGELSSEIKSIGDGLVLDENGELSVDGDIGGYTYQPLYQADTYTDAITFTFPSGKDLDSYDEIAILYGGVSDKPVSEYRISVNALKRFAPYNSATFALTQPHLFLLIYTNDSLRITLNSDNTGLLVKQRAGTTSCIREVAGIKF